MNDKTTPSRILPLIVIAQFFCTSLWFAGNAVLGDLLPGNKTSTGLLANLTSAVQIGFITGTLVFALLTIADRFSPSKVFFACSILAALSNMLLMIGAVTPAIIMIARFGTGFFLAGIYPVGMKIAADYYQRGLGRSLGFLVGALVLGTAFPHFLKTMTARFPWQTVIGSISALSVAGGLMMRIWVPDGPYRKRGQAFRFGVMRTAFANRDFRAAAIGYFGHMWELYAFWAFVPVILQNNQAWQQRALNIPLLSFLIIAGGAIACVLGGYLSARMGVKKTATLFLFLSGCCCLLSPFFVLTSSVPVLIAFLVCWGWVVIADSPLFSTLVAQQVPEQIRGTSITLVTCIGFSITIVSIQLMRFLVTIIDPRYCYLVLALGPISGIFFLLKKERMVPGAF